MIAIIGDVHDLLQPFRDLVERVPPNVHTIIQVGDLWVWPEEEDVPPAADGSRRELPKRPRDPSMHWRPPVREVHALDGNKHHFWLTRGVKKPTRVASNLTYLPRGTVMTLQGRDGMVRVGILGGADSVIDADWRRLGDDWWPDEEKVCIADVELLLTNAKAVGGLDLLITHTPPATVTTAMTHGGAPHPSSLLVEDAWRALGGAVADSPLEIISGHMHESYIDERLRVEVLPILGITIR